MRAGVRRKAFALLQTTKPILQITSKNLRPPSRVACSRLIKDNAPTVDNHRNLLLKPRKEMVSFLAAVDISLNANRTTAGYV